MLHRVLCMFALLLPVAAYAQPDSDIGKYLMGKWNVESVKERGDKAFHPPRHPVKWQFNSDNTMIEELGKSNARIHWHYRLVGRDIIVQLKNMSFRWRILSMEPTMMLIRHQLGLFKVKRVSIKLSH